MNCVSLRLNSFKKLQACTLTLVRHFGNLRGYILILSIRIFAVEMCQFIAIESQDGS